MLSALVRFAASAFGLWLSAELLEGVAVDSTRTLLIAAFLLGLINAIVRPLLVIVTFPLTLATFGLFLLVVNAATIGLTAHFLTGFTVDGFWSGVGAALITGLLSWIAGALLGEGKKDAAARD